MGSPIKRKGICTAALCTDLREQPPPVFTVDGQSPPELCCFLTTACERRHHCQGCGHVLSSVSGVPLGTWILLSAREANDGVLERGDGGEFSEGLFTKMWAGWGNQEKMVTLQRHREVPLPPLCLKGQRRAGPPQHCVLWSGDWTGTMGQETTN